KQTLIAVLVLLLFITANGQSDQEPVLLQTARFEKEHKFSDDDFTIISMKEDGIALVRSNNKYKSGNRSWELIILDSDLKEKHNLILEVDQRKNLIGYEQA